MSQPTVLVLSDDDLFVRSLLERWQNEPATPAFVLGASSRSANLPETLALALLGPFELSRTQQELAALRDRRGDVPALCVMTGNNSAEPLRRLYSQAVFVRTEGSCVEPVALLAFEMIRRQSLLDQAHALEQSLLDMRREAGVGRYMLEKRHSFNNALTSVLGNAELAMLDPEAIPQPMREQIAAIHTNAVKLHDLMHRLNLLDSELKLSHSAVNATRQSKAG